LNQEEDHYNGSFEQESLLPNMVWHRAESRRRSMLETEATEKDYATAQEMRRHQQQQQQPPPIGAATVSERHAANLPSGDASLPDHPEAEEAGAAEQPAQPPAPGEQDEVASDAGSEPRVEDPYQYTDVDPAALPEPQLEENVSAAIEGLYLPGQFLQNPVRATAVR
jgi:hypothetical protein